MHVVGIQWCFNSFALRNGHWLNFFVISIFARYELTSGESFFRQDDLGRALKKFLAVEKHYADITEDQFDFHTYCLRKMTLRNYVDMLKFQDQLHSHAYFHKAAAGAIRWIWCCILLACFCMSCYAWLCWQCLGIKTSSEIHKVQCVREPELVIVIKTFPLFFLTFSASQFLWGLLFSDKGSKFGVGFIVYDLNSTS